MTMPEKQKILFVLPKPEDPELIAGLVARFPQLSPTYIFTGTEYGKGHPDKGEPTCRLHDAVAANTSSQRCTKMSISLSR